MRLREKYKGVRSLKVSWQSSNKTQHNNQVPTHQRIYLDYPLFTKRMPSFIKNLTYIGLALATSASVASAAVANTPTNVKRMAPEECGFEGSRGDFSYISLDDGDSCLGFTDNIGCGDYGDGPWDEATRDDIFAVIDDQVAQSSWKSTTQSGDWGGNFFLGTNAYNSRDTQSFKDAFNDMDSHHNTYYWSMKGVDGYDKLRISHDCF